MKLLENTSAIYEHLAAGPERSSFTDIRVPDDRIRPLVSALRHAGESVLAEAGKIWYQQGSPWYAFYKALQQLHRAFLGLPLSYDHVEFRLLADRFQQASAGVNGSVNGELTAHLATIDELLAGLATVPNPILLTLREELTADIPTLLVLRRSFVAAGEAVLAELALPSNSASCGIMSHDELLPSSPARLICCGPLHWHLSRFVAPEAIFVDLLAFQWQQGLILPPERLYGESLSRGSAASPKVARKVSAVVQRITSGDPAADEVSTGESESEPADNWLDRLRRPSSTRTEMAAIDSPSSADADAWHVEFVNGAEIFLEEGSAQFVVRSSAREPIKVTAEAIQAADLLLRFPEHQGDYFLTKADQLLRRECTTCRAAQDRWKELLRAKVKESSVAEVTAQIRRLGSQLAKDVNVRSWCDPSRYRIRTRDFEDFRAITELLGYSAVQSEQAWTLLDKVDSAHRRATSAIKEELIRLLQRQQLDPAAIEIRLPPLAADASPAVLLRVRKVRGPYSVDRDQLNTIFT